MCQSIKNKINATVVLIKEYLKIILLCIISKGKMKLHGSYQNVHNIIININVKIRQWRPVLKDVLRENPSFKTKSFYL